MAPIGSRVGCGGTFRRSADQFATLACTASRDRPGDLRLQVLPRGRDLHALRLRGVDRRVHEQLELTDDAAWALECREQAIRIANRADREGATDLDPVDLERARAQPAHRASRDPNLVDSDRLRSSVAQLIQQVVQGDGVELTVDAQSETLPDHSRLPAER